MAALWRRHLVLGLAGLLAVASASSLSLFNYYTDPHYARFDFRSQVEKVVAPGPPGDAIIVNGKPEMAFFYYFKDEKPLLVVPRPGTEGQDRVMAELQSFVEGRQGLWLVKYMPPDHDPGNLIEGWLAANAFRQSQVWVENITFTRYSLPAVSLSPSSPAFQPVGADFDGRIILAGYAVDRPAALPGERLHLALYWQGQRPMAEDYTVFVHLVGKGERKVAQADSQPAGDTRPTRAWQPGEVVTDLRGLQIAPDAPPGEYRLLVGLYRPADGERLRLLREERPPSTQLELGRITIGALPSP